MKTLKIKFNLYFWKSTLWTINFLVKHWNNFCQAVADYHFYKWLRLNKIDNYGIQSSKHLNKYNKWIDLKISDERTSDMFD